MKKYIKPVLFYGGFNKAKSALRRIAQERRLYILMYHRVDTRSYPFFEDVVYPKDFEMQVCFLKKNYHIVDISQLDSIESCQTNDKDCIALTFDDGYRDVFNQAFPILKKYNVPATVFLATGYIDTHKLLWYDRLSWILYKTITIPDIKNSLNTKYPPILHTMLRHFFQQSLRSDSTS
jgi:hypothetical protein